MPEVSGGRVEPLASPAQPDAMIVRESQSPASANSPGVSSTAQPADPARRTSPLGARGLLSCCACGVVLRHGEHRPRLLPACLHTVCGGCVNQQAPNGEWGRSR